MRVMGSKRESGLKKGSRLKSESGLNREAKKKHKRICRVNVAKQL